MTETRPKPHKPRVRLKRVWLNPARGVEEAIYVYDYGDDVLASEDYGRRHVGIGAAEDNRRTS